MFKSQKGEIVTILAIAGAIVITLTSLLSSSLTKTKQTSTTKAGPDCSFHIEVDAYADPGTDGGKTFNNHVKFIPDGQVGGDIVLYNNGAFVAGPNGWNGSGPFDYEPQYTGGSLAIGKNGSTTITYKGEVRNCSSDGVKTSEVTCTMSVDSSGVPNISGGKCNAKNFTHSAGGGTTPVPTGSTFNGVCTDKDGVQRQACSNQNKCDIVGGCNPACCKVSSDCPNNQTCGTGIGAYNGYCKTNSSCDPNSGNNQPTATPIPHATEVPTPFGQECGKWMSDQCSATSCGAGTFCKNNHPISKCVCQANPTVIPTQPPGTKPTATVAPTAPPAGTVLYSCSIKVSGTVKGCIKGTPACGEVAIDPNDPNMKATLCIPKNDCTEANCLKIAREKSDAMAASQGKEITDFSNVRCSVAVGASCGTVPATGGLGGVRVEGKCADPNDTTKPQDCPAAYPQKGTDGKDMIVNRSCAQPNQGNQFCNYVCFTPDGTNIVECWSGQNGPIPGVDLLSFNLYLINKSTKPLDIVNVSICKPRMNIFKPIPSEDDFECTDNQSTEFTLATDQSKKINNNSGCSKDYGGWRKIQVSYRDQNDPNAIRLSAYFDATCSLNTVIALP